MITGELKNKIDSLWDIFAAGGLVNPLDVIEQITYLMFIHDLDDTDNLRAKEAAMLGLPYQSIFADEVQVGDRTIDGQQLKWSVFHDFPAGKMYSVMQEWVFPFIKNLHGDKNSAYSKYMDDAIFKLPTPLLLSKVVDALDEIYRLMNESQAVDVRGDTYEYLLSKIAQSGLNGQFRTPRHIIRMMVELMDPKADDVICDPACGTSGFLVSAGEYLKEHRKEEIFFNRQKKDHYMNHIVIILSHQEENVIRFPHKQRKSRISIVQKLLSFSKQSEPLKSLIKERIYVGFNNDIFKMDLSIKKEDASEKYDMLPYIADYGKSIGQMFGGIENNSYDLPKVNTIGSGKGIAAISTVKGIDIPSIVDKPSTSSIIDFEQDDDSIKSISKRKPLTIKL